MTFFVRVSGHELVKRKEKVEKGEEAHEYEMLRVTLKGVASDDKTKVTIEVNPEELGSYPLGEKGEVEFVIRQQRLELETSGAH